MIDLMANALMGLGLVVFLFSVVVLVALHRLVRSGQLPELAKFFGSSEPTK